MTIAEKYLHLLRERKVKTAEVSRQTGIPYSTLNEWSKGKTKKISGENLEKIAAFFNVPVDYFYTQSFDLKEYKEALETQMESFYSDPDVAEFAQAIHDKPEIRGLFKAARDLSKEDIERFKEIIESYERGKQG